jgi:hypothetical protein
MSSGYFSAAATATAAAAAPPTSSSSDFSTLAPLPTAALTTAAAVINLSSSELDDLSQMVESIVAHAPPPARAKWPLGYRINPESGGIWFNGEPSSATEPGFRAVICLDARPDIVPADLGLPRLDSYVKTVFLQRTRGPNEMFGSWLEDEAADNAAPKEETLRYGRRTLRLQLDDYLDLLECVRENWEALETRLPATVRQLLSRDQPVPLAPLLGYLGYGEVEAYLATHPNFYLTIGLDARSQPSGFKFRIELAGDPQQCMEIPASTLKTIAFGRETLISALRSKRVSRKRCASPDRDFLNEAAAAAGAATDVGDGSSSSSGRDKTASPYRNSKDPRQRKRTPPPFQRHGGKGSGHHYRK